MQCHYEGCGLPADKRCSRCREVFYCSPEHQKLDWHSHKLVCTPSATKVTQNNGVPTNSTHARLAETNSPSEYSTTSDSRQCRCMFCGEQLVLESEDAAVDHMRVCPALQEQLESPQQYTIPKAFQKIVNDNDK